MITAYSRLTAENELGILSFYNLLYLISFNFSRCQCSSHEKMTMKLFESDSIQHHTKFINIDIVSFSLKYPKYFSPLQKRELVL